MGIAASPTIVVVGLIGPGVLFLVVALPPWVLTGPSLLSTMALAGVGAVWLILRLCCGRLWSHLGHGGWQLLL